MIMITNLHAGEWVYHVV